MAGNFEKMSKVIVLKLAKGRFSGVADAASALGVSRNAIYLYANGWHRALGPKNRSRIEVIDCTVIPERKIAAARGRA